MKSIYLMAAGLMAAQAVRLDSSAQEKLYTYMQQQESAPVDATLVQGNPYKPRAIYDEDGDGVEDNVQRPTMSWTTSIIQTSSAQSTRSTIPTTAIFQATLDSSGTWFTKLSQRSPSGCSHPRESLCHQKKSDH